MEQSVNMIGVDKFSQVLFWDGSLAMHYCMLSCEKEWPCSIRMQWQDYAMLMLFVRVFDVSVVYCYVVNSFEVVDAISHTSTFHPLYSCQS